MHQKAEQILQKIGFIERDIELHKNILASIPEGQEKEMEDVIRKIVEMKERVEELKLSINEIDPEVYDRVQKLEAATIEFQQMAAGRNLARVDTLDQNPECSISLKSGMRVECLVKAQDDKGCWLILTVEGDVRQYQMDEVIGE